MPPSPADDSFSPDALQSDAPPGPGMPQPGTSDTQDSSDPGSAILSAERAIKIRPLFIVSMSASNLRVPMYRRDISHTTKTVPLAITSKRFLTTHQ